MNQQEPYRHKQLDQRLAAGLFSLGLLVYVLTRLIRLPDFPIFFFTDEAIQTQHAADLIANGFRGPYGVLLPTYFENGGQFNLSLSVYIQVLPTLLFGKSIWITRGVSALVSTLAAVFTALILKDACRARHWWLAPVLLAAVPAWFLHSRTAFETVLMASLYAGFLYFYLRYRQDQPAALFPALAFGGLAFYAYSPGQVILPLTGLLLLVADAPYHWRHRKTALFGLGLLALLALPYLRFVLTREGAALSHLSQLNSYWVKPLPLTQKVWMYLTRYLQGFNPLYWFWPNPSLIENLWPGIHLPTWLFSNQLDLARHTMKGYGHFPLITFPFWIIGILQAIRLFKNPEHRTLLLALLAVPSGAALIDWGITRGLAFIIPSTILIALGISRAMDWIQAKKPHWQPVLYSAGVFIFSAAASLWMLGDALRAGPTWYDDYGLAGMQYGARQVFTRAEAIARSEPETTVLVSSTWANGSDVLLRFFADGLPNLKMGNINAFAHQYQPLDRNQLFIMTEEDLAWIRESDKFTHVTVEETLPYPDGTTGFYFLRLDYVDDIQGILASEQEARRALHVDSVMIKGQEVQVQHPLLDMNEIGQLFDGDTQTLIRTLEANPLRLILTFPQPLKLSTLRLWIGGTPTEITVTALKEGKELARLKHEYPASSVHREVQLSFSRDLLADTLKIEVRNPHDGEIAHVHLWEVIIE